MTADLSKFIVRGCPAVDGGPWCLRGCRGGWPGTKVSSETLTQAVRAGTIKPNQFGCGPLTRRAEQGVRDWEDQV